MTIDLSVNGFSWLQNKLENMCCTAWTKSNNDTVSVDHAGRECCEALDLPSLSRFGDWAWHVFSSKNSVATCVHLLNAELLGSQVPVDSVLTEVGTI